ncbi:MAG: hypothetical protein ACOY93_09365 [Bacillota bacterium]
MNGLSSGALSQARERLEAMLGPVTLRLPAQNPAMRALAEELVALQEGEEPLLSLEQGEGESLTLLDGWGRETGICFRDLPVGQEFPVLLEALVAVSRGASSLTPLGRSQAGELPAGAELWVLVTPT